MTNAKNVPPVTEGSGRVVSAAPVRQQQTSSRQTRKFRRTNLLSALTPEERRCFLQERLNQSALFRQIAATKHGVVAPIEREVLGEGPSLEEYEEASRSRSISVEEVRRLEQLARREAMIEVREEVLRRTKDQLDVEGTPEPAPPEPAPPEPSVPDEPPVPAGIPEAEVILREELARREVELTNQEEALRQCQEAAEIRERASTEATRRSREEADIQRREEQDKENAIRAEQAQARREKDALRRGEQAAADRQRQEKAEEEAQRRELEEAQQRADAAAERLVADRRRKHDQRMEEFERQRQESERQRDDRDDHDDRNDTSPELPVKAPEVQDMPWYRRKLGMLFPGIGGIVFGMLGALTIMWWNGFPPTPPVVDPDHVVTDPVNVVVPVVDSDRDTLLLLQSRGLASPQTPLGKKILEAFEADPDFRVEVMQRVEDTLLQKEQPDPLPVPEGDLEQ